MENYERMAELLAEAKKHADAFFMKGNGSAGTRARGKLQEIKNLSQEMRVEIQSVKKGKA